VSGKRSPRGSRLRRPFLIGSAGSAVIVILVALPLLTSATTYVNDTSGWNAPFQNTQATAGCSSNANWWNINDVSSSSQKGQEFSYSRVNCVAGDSGTESKTLFMGIYGQNFTWSQPTAHYTYLIDWNVSYNWSLWMGGDVWQDCQGQAHAYLIIKSNVYDFNNQSNVWPGGASGTMRTFTQNCPPGPPNPVTSSGSELNDIIFNPAGHDGLYLKDGDSYSIWTEMIIQTSVSGSEGAGAPVGVYSDGGADIDMQHGGNYGKVVSLVIES
jgi:hypothetical protein